MARPRQEISLDVFNQPRFQTPFDRLFRDIISDEKYKLLNDAELAEFIVARATPWLNHSELNASDLQTYREALRGKRESSPVARELHNVRVNLASRTLPDYKRELAHITAQLIASPSNSNLKEIRHILGGSSGSFIGLNRIVDMMILDLNELAPHDLRIINPPDQPIPSIGELLNLRTHNRFVSADYSALVAMLWLDHQPATSELTYVKRALDAYIAPNPTRIDPSGRANTALQKLSKDIGSVIVRVVTGGILERIPVPQLINNGRSYLDHDLPLRRR